MKRLLYGLLLSLTILLVLAGPVLSAYAQAFTLTNGTTTSYVMLPITVSDNNTALASYGFISSTARDTRVKWGGTAVPHMVSDNKTLFATSLLANTTKSLTYGGGEAVQDMSIVLGNSGIITTLDDPALEPGSNFSTELKGYFDTSASQVGQNFFQKGVARLYVSAAGAVSAARNFYPSGIARPGTGSGVDLYLGGITRAGQKILLSEYNESQIVSLQFSLKKTGNPPGTISFTVRKVADGSLVGTVGTLNPATLTGGWVVYTITGTSVAFIEDSYVLAEYESGDGSNYVSLGYTTLDLIPGTYVYYAPPTWAPQPGSDADIGLGVAPFIPITTALSAGAHTLILAGDGSTLSLQVDGGAPVTASGATISDNASGFVWGSTATPFFEYIQHTVSGSQVLWYQPSAIISGTTLPDRTGAAQNGTITWGANPADVTVTISPISTTSTIGITSPGIAPIVTSTPVAPSGMYRGTEPDTSYIFFAPLINAGLDAGDIPRQLFWVPLAFATAIWAFVAVMHRTKGKELLLASIAAEVVMLLWWMGGNGVIPGWPLFTFPIPAIVAILRGNQFGWRS